MLLAIDTALENCSVGLFADHKMIASKTEALGRGHAERLFPMLEEVLSEAEADYSSVEKIAVTVGPGSFTGVRVGVAAARGLALSLDVPCVGVSSLAAIAHSVSSDVKPVIVTLDAKRGQTYIQRFNEEGIASSGPELVAADDDIAIDGALIVGTGKGPYTLDEEISAPSIEAVAKVGIMLSPDETPPKPLYLRGADAKPQTKNLIARADQSIPADKGAA